MGFLDKAAAKVGEATKAAQEGIAKQQSKRKADGLLRELGAWTYAKHKGGFDEADENIARVLGELAAHEAEHGELGAKEEEPPPPPPPAARAADGRPPPPPPPPSRHGSGSRPPPPRRRPPRSPAPPAPVRRPRRPCRRAPAAAVPGDPVPPPPPTGRSERSASMTRVGVFGAAGRMGSTVCEAVEGDPDLELVAAVDPLHAGIDLRRVADVDTHLQVASASEALVDAGAEVVVDFTVAEAARAEPRVRRRARAPRGRGHHRLHRRRLRRDPPRASPRARAWSRPTSPSARCS